MLSMGVVHVEDVSRYGALDIEAHRVRAFCEKGDSGPGTISAGVYLFSPEALACLPDSTVFSLERDFLLVKLDKLRPLAFELPPPFIDIGLPEDYLRAQSLLI